MSRKGGAELVVRALEDCGARWTFGIPGTHNTELYDALEESKRILPVLVTDEQSASFMADAVSRSSAELGVANVVPGAGVTHTLSGVAEAFMDNVPILVLTCGIRTDTGKAFQLHDIPQLDLLKPITKGVFRPATHAEIYPTIRRAADLARSGTPGPVAVEISANLYLLTEDVAEPSYKEEPPSPPVASAEQLEAAAALLSSSSRPALYLGAGAKDAASLLIRLAECLGAPVATTISGKGVFPESHPLWVWNGFGAMAPGFAREVFDEADCLLAIGCRFGEVATASYGMKPPANLIHVDINPDVLNRNYPAKLAIAADAEAFVEGLLERLATPRDSTSLRGKIALGHSELRAARRGEASADRVSPAAFFKALQQLAPRAIFTTDSGNGTFLAMEHLRLDAPGRFLGPVDYSCMGYAVPGAIGAKFAHPEEDVVALAGDGALLMTGLELLTASAYKTAPLVCVLRDGELGQIAQFQRATLDRDTCSVLSPYRVEDLARLVGAEYLALAVDADIIAVLRKGFELTRAGKPVMVETLIDYSHKTFFTRGVVETNLWRLPLSERLRMVGRAVARKVQHALLP